MAIASARSLKQWAGHSCFLGKVFLLLALLAPLGAITGCAGLVSSASSTGNPPPQPALAITNVQAPSATTSTSQIVWTTNVAADSAVDYGTSTSYGSSTPVDSAMVTSHQVTLSGLAASSTYYYQVRSSDSKNNHANSGGHPFKTAGFSIAGTINPATGGSGATLTLSGAASSTTTADSLGNYTFSGLANGTYTVSPSRVGYTFTPNNQSATVNGANVTGVNFTDTAQTFNISGAISPTAGGSGATLTLSGAAGATTTANSSGAYTFTGLASGSYTITPSNTGYTFNPLSQNVAVSTLNVTGVNFTANAAPVAPTITTQPTSQTVTAGQTATFTLTATGTAPLSYQWQKNGGNIAGATSASYTTPAMATTDSGSTFVAVVSNPAGTVTSAAATLTVNAAPVAPTITTQPTNQTVTAGQTATFTVVASGTSPLSYQWRKSGANIAGATSASYTTPATATSDSGSTFAVVVSNSVGTATSAAATLTVNAAAVAPTITTQPTNQTVRAGQTATFTVVASGTSPLSYQWQKSGANIAGATAASYTTPATTTSDSGSTFRVVVSNTAGTATSAAATLIVNPAPAPGIQVSSTSLNFGNSVVGSTLSQVLIITNTGTATLSITQVSETGSASFTVSGFSLPLNVNAGQQTTITVAFLPTSAGSVSGAVSLVSNAPTSPTTIALSGMGVAPTFLVGANPTSLNFGNVNVGSTSSLIVTLTNNGNSNVTISTVTVTGTGFSASGVTSGTVLTPNQSATVNVAFAPTAAGSVTGSVSVVSNATNSPISITLAGSGQTTAPPGQWISGYYSSQNGVLPVSSIPWSKYTHVIHFAAAPGLDGSGNGNGTVELHYLSQADINAVIAARPAGKQVLVCIKDNDSHLSAFAQSTAPATIATFVSNIASFVNANQYDGVDIDWEQNINVTQYSDLLTRLRNAMPAKTITIAAGNWGGLPSVAGASYSQLDQINLMCYDMDSPANGYSWYNDALLQSGNAAVMTCDWRARAFTSAGVAASKIGIGIPFYGRRWPGVTLPLVNGSFNPSTVLYRDLVSDGTRWQPQYQFYDSIYKSDYLSIPGLNEFVSYDGAKTINDAVAWQKSQGFGGFMTFTLEYEYLSNQTGNSRYPLSTGLCQDVFGTCP